jgi:hypothetical protein
MLVAALCSMVAAALLAYAAAAPTAALPNCTSDDLLSYLNPATGVVNATKMVETVVKATAASGVLGSFLVSAWIAIIGLNYCVGKPDNFTKQQVEILVTFRISVGRTLVVNALL